MLTSCLIIIGIRNTIKLFATYGLASWQWAKYTGTSCLGAGYLKMLNATQTFA